MLTASATIATDTATQTNPECRWPEADYFVSERLKLVHCPIYKIACTSFKLWWAELENEASAGDHPVNVWIDGAIDHSAIDRRFKLRYQPLLGRRPLIDNDWFRFVFVRNPWARLVSAFINKFVPNNPLAEQVYPNIHRRWQERTREQLRRAWRGAFVWNRSEKLRDPFWRVIHDRQAWREELTFRHFVDYIASQPLAEHGADVHWRPQHLFLGNTSFHFVGRFERLDEDQRAIAEMLGIPARLPSINRTAYHSSDLPVGCFADVPLRKLRKLTAMPGYRNFYSRQLQNQVGLLYSRDIEQFNYDF